MQLGIISDIHEDISNLRKALTLLDDLGVDEIVCLGDIVGYNVESSEHLKERDATACINLVKNNCTKVVPGNHDLYAIRKIPVHRGGFDYRENWYDLDYSTRKHMGNGKIWLYEETELSALLDAAGKAYLDSLPETDSLVAESLNVLLTHYIYPNLTGSLTGFAGDKMAFDNHLKWMKAGGFDVSFSGHGHIPGFALANDEGFAEIGFGKTGKISRGSAVIVPAIVRGKKTPGFLTFDTGSLEITAHSLSY